MRKIIICVLLFLVHLSSFSQQTDPELTLTAEDYLKKSKNQKTVGTALMVSGLALFVTGAIIPGADPNCDGLFCGLETVAQDGAKITLKTLGVLSALGSIPLFIVSNDNERRAAELTLSTQRIIHMDKRNLVYTSFPVLGIKISF